jgi:hypothetical protein
VLDPDFTLPIGKAKVMLEGSDVTLVAFSKMVREQPWRTASDGHQPRIFEADASGCCSGTLCNDIACLWCRTGLRATICRRPFVSLIVH